MTLAHSQKDERVGPPDWYQLAFADCVAASITRPNFVWFEVGNLIETSS